MAQVQFDGHISSGILTGPNFEVLQETGTLVRGSGSASLFHGFNPSLESKLQTGPIETDTLETLSNAGNWVELFDSVAKLGRQYPEETGIREMRNNLLKQAEIEITRTN